MKQFRLMVLGMVLVAGIALADTATVSLTVTNGQAATLSDAISASGWLDKIEIVNSDGAGATCAVVVATYTSTTAIDTLATATVTTPKVFRTRVQPTANTGTAIPAVVGNGSDALTNLATTVLVVPYEKVLIGGNLKMSVAGTAVSDGTNTTTATLFYEPLKR
jgi:malate/lactate dehydrogenase